MNITHKLVVFGASLLMTTSVLAFGGGGGGHGRVSTEYKNKGVDAIGIYQGGEGQANVNFGCENPNEQGLCENDQEGSPELTDACDGFISTECVTACTSNDGIASYTYAMSCHNGDWNCNNQHECVNPCTGNEENNDCLLGWTAVAGICQPNFVAEGVVINHKVCDGNGDYTCEEGYVGDCSVCAAGYIMENGICVVDACLGFTGTECVTACTNTGGIASYTYAMSCHNGDWNCNDQHECVDPCSLESHSTNDCLPSWSAQNGECQPNYISNGTVVNHKVCDGNGDYTCEQGYTGDCSVCAAGYIMENDICVVNSCDGFVGTECVLDCTSTDGLASYTYAMSCHNGDWNCNDQHECVNPCTGNEETNDCLLGWSAVAGVCEPDSVAEGTIINHKICDGNGDYTCEEGYAKNATTGECEDPCLDTVYNTECQTCVVVNGVAKIENQERACGPNGQFICDIDTGACTDPCAGTTNTTCVEHVAQNGVCIVVVHAERSCGSNKICGEAGDCKACISGYTFWNDTCLEPCPEGQSYDSNGSCSSCPSSPAGATTEEICLSCFANGFWNSKGECQAACTSGKYHILSGTCNSCTTDTRSETTARECSQTCGEDRTLIYQETEDGVMHYYCAIKTCSAGRFHQTDGKRNGICMSCAQEDGVKSTPEECALCTTNRRYYDGIYCRLCPTSIDSNKNDAYSCAQCFDGQATYYNTKTKACSLCPTSISNATNTYSCSQCFGGEFIDNICQTP